MNNRCVSGAIALAIAFFGSACDDRDDLTGTVSDRNSSVVTNKPVQTYDDMLARVAELEPAFGGMAFQNGALVVSVTRPDVTVPTLRDAIYSVFRDERLRSSEMRLQNSNFSFSQLYAWRNLMPMMVSLVPGLHFSDIDELSNRLVLGVLRDGDKTLVAAALQQLNVPSEAVTIETREPLQALATLRDVTRPVVGGLLTTAANGGRCTIGFNGGYASSTHFATNGHCSTTWGSSSDATLFYQPTILTSYAIGNEVVEAPVHNNAQTSDCITSSFQCRYSDLLLGNYSTQSAGLIGYIYGTTSSSATIGSITTNQLIPIVDEILWPVLGDELHKIGQRTGWTVGQVQQTCASSWFSGPGSPPVQAYMMCYYGVDAGSYRGDSGSAVFYYNSGTNQAKLVGQLFAGYNGITVIGSDTIFNRFAFSSMNNIQAQFGNVITTIHGWY